jgi:hypothetical protein
VGGGGGIARKDFKIEFASILACLLVNSLIVF